MIIPGDPKLLVGLEGNAEKQKKLNAEEKSSDTSAQ